ncbi:hypothetical protein AAC387_Pa02g3691 [Persea americana]
MASVGRMKLGSQGLEVSAQGLGCLGMSAFYGPPKPEADMITLIHRAVRSGITFLDTSDMYGPFTNEILLGKALKGIRKEVELATKFGVSNGDGRGKWEICGDPTFQPENLKQNASIFERVTEMAKRKGCTPSQLALAWAHNQGNDVCPIPGTTKIENLNQNIGALFVKLTPEEMVELESLGSADVVKGERYGTRMYTWMDSETPDLSLWKGI